MVTNENQKNVNIKELTLIGYEIDEVCKHLEKYEGKPIPEEVKKEINVKRLEELEKRLREIKKDLEEKMNSHL